MKSKIIFLFLFVFLLSIVSVMAETYEEGENILISHAVRLNEAPSSSINCNITIEDQDGFVILAFKDMVNNATSQRHEYMFGGGNTTDNIGDYCYDLTCVGGGYNQTENFCFEVTPDGTKPDTSQGIIYVGIVIMSFIGCLVCLLCCFNTEKKYLKLGLGILSYILFNWVIFVLWQMSENYLRMGGLGSIFKIFFIFTTAGMFPVFIIGFIIILAELKNDKLTQNLLKRGVAER